MLNIRQFLLLLWSFLQRWNLGCGFFWLLFALVGVLSRLLQTTWGQKISPVPGMENGISSREGEDVTLRCNYETSDSYVYLHWYKHQSDYEAPHLIQKYFSLLCRYKAASHLSTFSCVFSDGFWIYKENGGLGES
uniref:Ig-like domain-containing protein n=1 Tax=Takifugu rubripes TaxID=31033 RepID=A0A674P629_TAKRU